MQTFTHWTLTVFFFLISSTTQAALTLEEVFQSVRLHSPQILSAQQDLEKSQAELFSAQGGFDPILKAQVQNTSLGYYANTYSDLSVEQPTPFWGSRFVAGYRKGIGSFPIYESKYSTFDQGEWRVGMEIPLLKGGSIDERRTRILTSELGITQAETSLQSKIREIQREASRKYWDWLSAGQKIKVAEELLHIAMVREKAILTRIKKGDTPEIDHTDNLRTVMQRKAALISAQRSLQKAALELSLYYRNQAGNPISPSTEDLPETFPQAKLALSPNSSADLAIQYPDVQTLQWQSKQMEAELRLSQNQLLPKLDLQVALARDFGLNPGTLYLAPTSYPSELRVSLTLEIPLFLRTARGKRNAVAAQNRKLELLQDLTRNRIQIQIEDSTQAMVAAKTRMELSEQEVTLAKKLEDAEKTRFQHGDSSLLTINIREQLTQDALHKNIEAISDFFKAQTDYQTLTQP